MRSRSAWLTALSCAVVLAGCGGGGHERRAAPPPPRLSRDLAAQLATLSDRVAARLDAEDGCGAQAEALRLQAAAQAAAQHGRIPAELGEVLLPTITDLVGRIHCTPAPAQDKGEHGKHKGKKKHEEKGD